MELLWRCLSSLRRSRRIRALGLICLLAAVSIGLFGGTGCYLAEPVPIVETPCVNCHEADYANAKNPDHSALNFSNNCATCHSKMKWSPAQVQHDKFFPLVGAHSKVACSSCHQGNVFKGTPRTCVGCHQKDYDGVQRPNHVKLNYSKTCTNCHTQTAWKPAQIDHDKFFPLVGAHKTLECAKCHKTEDYKGAPRTCIGCHQADFDGAKQPDHAASGFSKTCTECHTQTAWKPSTFNHEPKFPLQNGPHAQLRNDCGSCHKDKSNFKKFECIQCHEHRKDKMDGDHGDVNGYVYASKNCYQCHPNGQAE